MYAVGDWRVLSVTQSAYPLILSDKLKVSRNKRLYPNFIKCKQNIINHNTINDFIKMYSYIVSFNDKFRL